MTFLEHYTVIREQYLSWELSDEHNKKLMCHVSNSHTYMQPRGLKKKVFNYFPTGSTNELFVSTSQWKSKKFTPHSKNGPLCMMDYYFYLLVVTKDHGDAFEDFQQK